MCGENLFFNAPCMECRKSIWKLTLLECCLQLVKKKMSKQQLYSKPDEFQFYRHSPMHHHIEALHFQRNSHDRFNTQDSTSNRIRATVFRINFSVIAIIVSDFSDSTIKSDEKCALKLDLPHRWAQSFSRLLFFELSSIDMRIGWKWTGQTIGIHQPK